MVVTLEEAKEYLKVDQDYEDNLITTLINSAEKLCADVARLEVEDYETKGEVAKIATLYALGFMFENRSGADVDYQKLPLILRSLLFSIREG